MLHGQNILKKIPSWSLRRALDLSGVNWARLGAGARGGGVFLFVRGLIENRVDKAPVSGDRKEQALTCFSSAALPVQQLASKLLLPHAKKECQGFKGSHLPKAAQGKNDWKHPTKQQVSALPRVTHKSHRC